MTALWVGLGSALGGMARYYLTQACVRWWGEAFPWGTLAVNVVGSLVIGLLATLMLPEGRWSAADGELRQFVLLGVLGGFTTFSAFSLQTLQLLIDGVWWRGAAYIVGSVMLCVGGAYLGYIVASTLNR